MKILWVKAGKILPVDAGGKIRSFNILRHLARKHEIVFLSYYRGTRDPAYETAISQQLPGTQTIHIAGAEGGFAQSLDYLLRLPSPVPYAVKKFSHRKVYETVQRSLSTGGLDVAVCDFLSASLNFPGHSQVPVVLFQHNVETMLWRRMADTETNLPRKISYSIEAHKMERYETQSLQRFQHIIAVSQSDRDAMHELSPECLITVVPTGVDTEQYKVAPTVMGVPPLVVFTGSMDWEPNIDAMEYFCSDIWPVILTAFPDARFQIVGRNPNAKVRRLASSSVEVTGTVSSVIEYLRAATVVVVPLRIGGGTRLKIFEAMAMAKAMVSTSIGAEGLDVTDGRDLLIADNTQLFADSILRFLRDPKLRRSCEQSAAALAARYDWSQIARQFADVLAEAVASFHGGLRPANTAALPVQP
jgi:glycosyltransferase involved in cell wall biosynthesis